jgi:1,4-dihydroxy-6-naphthoate synthase
MLFSDIEGAVLDGKVQAGVIIHENRFTYQQKGLVKIMDLGKNWEEKTGAPIPLGGIVLKKEFDQLIGIRINALIKKSIAVSYANYPILSGYVKQHAREMSEKVMKQHIDLYVNHYSLSLGEEGRKAIDILMNTYNTASKDEISIIG